MTGSLTEADFARVREAVAAAERRTSGEIVPYVVERSGAYPAAVWRGAAGVAIGALVLAMLVLQFYDGWGLGWLYAGWGVALVAVLAGTLGAVLAATVAPLGRLLAGDAELEEQVGRRAALAFLEEEVFLTRERTGILLFVSLFEHRIVVLGDAGINAKVEQAEWAEVVSIIRSGVRRGHLTDGLVAAIERCGALLEQKGVAIRVDDAAELPDDLRVRRR